MNKPRLITAEQENETLARIYELEEKVVFLQESLTMTMQCVNALMQEKKKND
jgi:Mg2+ and Co2+ transporter CorA